MIRDFIKKINQLNNMEEYPFWYNYLQQLENYDKFTWYHSAGFDLRPFRAAIDLSTWDNVGTESDLLAKELISTEFVYSDMCFYDLLLDLRNKIDSGTLTNSYIDMNFNTHFSSTDAKYLLQVRIDYTKHISSVVPFCLFTKEERKIFVENTIGLEKFDSIEKRFCGIDYLNQEYDGFFIQLKGSCTYSCVTIIYLTMPDQVAKAVMDFYGFKIVAIFESTAGGGFGGASALTEIYTDNDSLKDIKYIFTDKYIVENGIGKMYYPFNHLFETRHISSGGQFYLSDVIQNSPEYTYGNAFCYAKRKGIMPSIDSCLDERIGSGYRLYASKKRI